MLIAHTELLLQTIERYWGMFKRRKAFYLVKTALGEGVIELVLNFVAITLRF